MIPQKRSLVGLFLFFFGGGEWFIFSKDNPNATIRHKIGYNDDLVVMIQNIQTLVQSGLNWAINADK